MHTATTTTDADLDFNMFDTAPQFSDSELNFNMFDETTFRSAPVTRATRSKVANRKGADIGNL